MTDEERTRVAGIARRIGEARSQRILAASRVASELYAIVSPFNDRHLLRLVDQLQARLADRLPTKPDGDG